MEKLNVLNFIIRINRHKNKINYHFEHMLKCSCHGHAYILENDHEVPMITMAFWHQCMDNVKEFFSNRIKFAWTLLTKGEYHNDQMVIHESQIEEIYNFGIVVHVMHLLCDKKFSNPKNDFDNKCLEIYKTNQDLGLDTIECLKIVFNFVEDYVKQNNIWRENS